METMIGIIGAMDIEIEGFVKNMTNPQTEKYSMFENKIVRDYRDNKVTKEELVH